MVVSNEKMATRLIAPIHASEAPIAPKIQVVLLSGLFGGLFLGLIIAFGRQIIPNLKVQLENNIATK